MDSNLKVAHPSRVGEYGAIDAEDYDSVFCDVMIHKHRDTALSNRWFFAVMNRRSDPRLLESGDWVFRSEGEYEDLLAAQTIGEFDQRGAREIRLPFNYESNTAVNLHVTEIVPDTAIGIDTVIGSQGTLAIRLRPGQAKFFRVIPIPASSSQYTGFLDHSNQRKIVAFPVIDTMVMAADTVEWGDTIRTYLRMVAGDTMRYHRVFHRRIDLPGAPEGGPLTVWYQRSSPIIHTDTTPTGTSQYAFDASTITWEPPINVSSRIFWQPPGYDSAMILTLSCGFPSLVVRIDTLAGARIAKVYIVFGCEYDRGLPSRKVLVCESVLPADATNTEQAAFYGNDHSEVFDFMPVPLAYPVTQTNFLEHWGTPMLNASASGNYYCWSHSINGIGAGFKEPHRRKFQAGQTEYIRLYENLASHPSMHSYSRLHIGEDDAGLVWQEGGSPDLGEVILYTRLKHDINNLIYHEISADPTPEVEGPPIISVDNTIAQLSGGQVTIDSTNPLVVHAYPVLYRQMSDWNMTPENKFYYIGIVNYKAERAYWQTKPWQFTNNNRWVIGRRIFDIAEWTNSWFSWLSSDDTVRSSSDNFIFSDNYHLHGPDATQGEQWGEWGSDPEYASWDHDDSTSVLEFWSDTSETDPIPMLWHLTLSWALYGSDVDYDHADLVADGSLKLLNDNGRYPHLASRYSMIGNNNKGWQRNRRIFNPPGGNWVDHQNAPWLTTSSEYFYKDNRQSTPQGLRYVGFRGSEGWGVVAPIHLKDQDRLIVLKSSKVDENGYTTAYASEWTGLPEVGDITVATKAIGKELVSEFLIQRESDSEVFSMNAMAKNQDGETWRKDFTLLSSKDDRYRFLIERTKERLWPAEDIEIRLEKMKTKAKEEPSRAIIDLRTMEAFGTSAEPGLVVYPNPADEIVTVVINTGIASAELMPGITNARHGAESDEFYLEITNSLGITQMQMLCRNVDVDRIDVSTWPIGTYQAAVVNATGVVSVQRFSVIR